MTTAARVRRAGTEAAQAEQSIDIERASGTEVFENAPSDEYRLYSAAELDDLPPAEWLIDQAIPRHSIVGAIGAKGHMKTFAVLDIALHVATGLPWHGRVVKPGAVVYIYAEGPFGAKARVDAWCDRYSTREYPFVRRELPIWFLPRRLTMNSATSVAALTAQIRRRIPTSPVMIVVDTLNQNLEGDEDGKGMTGFVAGCARLRDTFAATVIAVHHTPLGAEDRGRGHTAFDGALDTRLLISRDASRVTVECSHQRNGEDGWTVAYQAVDSAGSLALEPSGPNGGKLEGQRRQLLEVVHQQGPLKFKPWHTETGLGGSSFKKARKWLADKGYVAQDGKNYVITESGRLALGHQGHHRGHHGQ